MFIADFHIHSKYSRATSKDCAPESLDFWARRKGIRVIGTGDFTHRAWREELKEKLLPSGEGLYTLKDDFRLDKKVAGAGFRPQFIVTGEISSIYKKNGRTRKVHNLIMLPDLEHAELISRRLEAVGNLHSDGRPILGLDSRDLLEIVLEVCPEAIFIPAHIWTPHFSLFGAYSGFDHIEECFEDLTGYIFALETGLSSDPPMNWRLSALDNYTLVSNSDAHSPGNLGREANIFNGELSYRGMLNALKNRHTGEFYGTIEFFPEEGKYHYDGHRACKVCCKPAETRAAGGICPVCGGRLTVGVLHRVETLADREEGFIPPGAKPFESLVPLKEVVAASIGYTVNSKKVRERYESLLENLGPELFILREASLRDIELAAGAHIAEGVRRLRSGRVERQPGYDGEYGKITILDRSEIESLAGQLSFVSHVKTEPKKSKSGAKIVQQERVPSRNEKTAPTSAENALSAALYRLNDEQWEAVLSSSPAIAVIAGPGTGKTGTLVCRIAYLVEKCGVHPSRITAVTFTNKAAGEMRLRLEKHFGDKHLTEAMTIGTFHSICLQLLSRWSGGDKITIIDEYQALSIVEAILTELNLKVSPRNVRRNISLLKNGTLSLEEGNGAPIPEGVYNLYNSRLQDLGVLDYDDILLEVLRRFEEGKAGEEAGRNRENPFSYLLVDEFQDINEIQYRLIRQWSKKSKSIFVIGDPDQAIYGFRGSDFRYFARFAEDFPATRQIRLTRNYRSTPEIITCARAVLYGKAAGGVACNLQAERASGEKVRLLETGDDFTEALFVAGEISRMVGGVDMLDAHKSEVSGRKEPAAGGQLSFSDVAVLYRTNRQADILEQCFIKAGIPYVVAGGDQFLADELVRQALAFFKFLLNPGDLASLLLCLRGEGFSPTDLKENTPGRYAAGEKSVSSFIEIMEGMPPSQKPGKLRTFLAMLRKYETVIGTEKPWQIIESWIKDKNLTGVRSLELLLHTSLLHNEMDSFLQNLLLGRESDIVRSGGKVYSPEAVSLMTIHGAKGLEFPVVFICGIDDGTIPLRNTHGDCDMGEERRLFYVGMTRAQDELILLTSGNPSPFLNDLAAGQLIRKKIVPEKEVPRYRQASLFD